MFTGGLCALRGQRGGAACSPVRCFCFFQSSCTVYMYAFCAFVDYPGVAVCLHVRLHCTFVCICTRIFTRMYTHEYMHHIHVCGFCIRRSSRRVCVFGCGCALRMSMDVYSCMYTYVYSQVQISNTCMRFCIRRLLRRGCVFACEIALHVCMHMYHIYVHICIHISTYIEYMYAVFAFGDY